MKQHLTLLPLAFAAIGTAAPTSCNTDNPFLDRIQYANSHYATQLEQTIESFTVKNDTLDAARVRTVQTASTFIWVAEFAGIAGLEGHLDEAIAAQQLAPDRKLIVPFVIYNLPNRDCAAKASAGELSLSDGGEEKYREFVDQIYTTITAAAYEDLDFAVVVEPDSLGNSITNLGIAECAEAASAYLRGIGYVIEKLGRLENVALYIDAAHSNWLGWPDNLEPTANIMKEVVDIANGNQTNATNPAKIRGYSTNVSNYNSYNSTTPDPIYGGNPNWSELRYATALSSYLEALGLPVHFIIDQGRAGQPNIRDSSSNWCNVNDAGLGIRPTTDTSDCIVDSIVWVKPPGQSDGTSDQSSARFDTNCVSDDAFVPSPEAGSWNNDYVEVLVKNANPPVEPAY